MPREADENVFGAYVVVAEPLRLMHSLLEGLFRFGRKRDLPRSPALSDFSRIALHAELCQHLCRDGVPFKEHAAKKMFRSDVTGFDRPSCVGRVDNHIARALRELLERG